MAPPRRGLIAVTSAHAPLYPEGKGTGMFVTEALHPYNVFHEEGFEVDLVSETGSYQPDWLSTTKDWLPEEDRKVWEDASSEFRKKLDAHLKPSDIKPEKYGLFFASAGHVSLIDYPDATGLQDIASKMLAFALPNLIVDPPLCKSPVGDHSDDSHGKKDGPDIACNHRRMAPLVLRVLAHAADHSTVDKQPKYKDTSLRRGFSNIEPIHQLPAEIQSKRE